MTPCITVPPGFGKKIRNLRDLSKSEISRLTSNTLGPKDNLKVEFELEKRIIKTGSNLGIKFCNLSLTRCDACEFSVRTVDISHEEESALISKLDLPTPKTTDIATFLKKPFFPTVFKNPESRKGREVFKIDNLESFDKLQAIIKSIPNEDINKFIFQEYIKTPSENFTSYRVLVSCVGEIISAALIYSGNKKADGALTNYHNLSFPKITSNRSAGGGGIVLNPIKSSKPALKSELKILKYHNIKPINPQLPEIIIEGSKRIGLFFGKNKKSLIFGIDWIQSDKNKYYYLETNASPGSKTFIDSHMTGTGTHLEAVTIIMTKLLKSIAVFKNEKSI